MVAIAVFGPYFPVARDDMKDWVRTRPPLSRKKTHLPFLQPFPCAPHKPPPLTRAPAAAPQPLIGRVLRLWGYLGVPRELPGGQKGVGLASALVERTNKADGPWMEYPPVLIYPEGALVSLSFRCPPTRSSRCYLYV